MTLILYIRLHPPSGVIIASEGIWIKDYPIGQGQIIWGDKAKGEQNQSGCVTWHMEGNQVGCHWQVKCLPNQGVVFNNNQGEMGDKELGGKGSRWSQFGEFPPPYVSMCHKMFIIFITLYCFNFKSSTSLPTHLMKSTPKDISLLHVVSLGLNVGFHYIIRKKSTLIITNMICLHI